MKIKRWLGDVRDRLVPGEYVHASEVPEEPEGPYRARLALASVHGPEGVEVGEREMVRGRAEIVYMIHCDCGRRWFILKFESLQTCPRCQRAVLVREPELLPRPALQ